MTHVNHCFNDASDGGGGAALERIEIRQLCDKGARAQTEVT